jgi:hypothetical protein
MAKATAYAVWNTTRNIRDSIKIARMAKGVEDVDWLVTTFLDSLGTNVADRIPKTLMLHQPTCPKSLIIQERTLSYSIQ